MKSLAQKLARRFLALPGPVTFLLVMLPVFLVSRQFHWGLYLWGPALALWSLSQPGFRSGWGWKLAVVLLTHYWALLYFVPAWLLPYLVPARLKRRPRPVSD